jgi:hypothetical protein
LSGEDLPPVTAPRAPERITLSGRLARVYGYASLTGPALFSGLAEQAQAMLEMALAACRDPRPGADRHALEMIAAALDCARELGRGADGTAGALNLIYCSMVCAATETPPPPDDARSAR